MFLHTGSSSLWWRHGLEGNLAGTVKWKGVQIVQQRGSPQLSTSRGLLTGLDFLLDLRSFFTYCDGWLDYRYREFNNYHLKLTEMQNNVKFCSFLCPSNLSKNTSRTKPHCTGGFIPMMCSVHLMCFFNLLILIKVLAALWNILWFFLTFWAKLSLLKAKCSDEYCPCF